MFHVGEELLLNNGHFKIVEHPAAPGVPYGQEGRVATVYKLQSSDGTLAIKVFKKKYRDPMLVGLTKQLQPFAQMDGLRVCNRYVLTPQNHPNILAKYSDLLYSAIMPWIEGETWMDVILDKKVLNQETSHRLVKRFLQIMVNLEEQGIAHCDLSGANIMLSGPADDENVELVDVEQLFAPGLNRPTAFTAGTQGYVHPRSANGNWNATADRFAGAILLVEMMGWLDGRIRAISWDESYFKQEELQQNTERYHLLKKSLKEHWGQRSAGLLEQVWNSASPTDCPTFGEWYLALYNHIGEVSSTQPSIIAASSPRRASQKREATAHGPELPPVTVSSPPSSKGDSVSFSQKETDSQTVSSNTRTPEPTHAIEPTVAPTPPSTHPPTPLTAKSTSPKNPISPLLSTDERWQPDNIPDDSSDSRTNTYLAAFVGVAALVGLLILVFNNLLTGITNALWNNGGYGLYIGFGAGALSFIVSLIQVWIFRYRLPSDKRTWFVLATTVAGVAGGLFAGILISSYIIPWSLAGMIVGIIGGPIASFAQSTLIRNNEAKGRWIVWNSAGWITAWTVGWYLGVAIAPHGMIGMAGSAIFVTIVIGLSLVWFLKSTPEFEF